MPPEGVWHSTETHGISVYSSLELANKQADSNIRAFSTQAIYRMVFWVIFLLPRLTGLFQG